MPAVQRLLTFIVAAAIVIATTSAQILSPIVPMNHPYGGVGGGGSGGGGNGDFAPLGGYGAPVRPSYVGNGALFAAQPPPQQQPAFATLGASSSPYAAIGVGGDVFGSSFAGTGSASDGGGDWPSPDYGAYRQNAALLQKASYGGGGLDGLQSLGGGGNMDARSPPHSSFGASSFGASSATPLRRAAMPPIQVVYGKPAPMESQSEQSGDTSALYAPPVASATAATSTAAAVSSLPQFLQGASSEIVDEVGGFNLHMSHLHADNLQYKRIIRSPNSNYDDQVKKLDELVLRLDDEHQAVYRQFMQENDEREQKHRDRIHGKIGEMSEKAQEQFAKISTLLRNSALPNEERWARVLALYGKLEPKLRDEFEAKFANFAPLL